MRAHARRAAAGRAARCSPAHQLPLGDVDLFAVASGPARSPACASASRPCRGWRSCDGAPDRRRVGARGAGAHGGGRRAAPARSSAPGSTRIGATSSRRCIGCATRAAFAPERLVEVEAPAVGDPAATLATLGRAVGGAPAVFVGDGAVLYADAIAAARRRRARSPAPPLLAGDDRPRWRIARARGEAQSIRRPMQPLYVRRPDVGDRAGRDAALGSTASLSIGIEPLDVAGADRRRPRDRGGVVHQSRGRARCIWPSCRTRRVVLLIWRADDDGRSSASARSGGWSTSCTSTTWRCCRSSGATGIGTALLHARAARRRAARGAARHARGAASRTRPPGACTSGSASRSPASGAAYYTNPVEDAFVLWREDLDAVPVAADLETSSTLVLLSARDMP